MEQFKGCSCGSLLDGQHAEMSSLVNLLMDECFQRQVTSKTRLSNELSRLVFLIDRHLVYEMSHLTHSGMEGLDDLISEYRDMQKNLNLLLSNPIQIEYMLILRLVHGWLRDHLDSCCDFAQRLTVAEAAR